MIAPQKLKTPDGVRFRTKLLVAMMVVVSVVTLGVLFFMQRQAAAAVKQELQREFQGELAALHSVQELRHAALVERCRALVRRPRIHAALEDDALDLLYPSADDELRDILIPEDQRSMDRGSYGLHAAFYRFLDRTGAVIPPLNAREVGRLSAEEEALLALPEAPARPHLGYLVRQADDARRQLAEIIAMPIISMETGEPIAMIVLGFKPAGIPGGSQDSEIKRGLWLNGELHFDSVSSAENVALTEEVTRAIAENKGEVSSFGHLIGQTSHLLFFKQLNEGSAYPAAYEVCIYPLEALHERERQIRWSVLGAGTVLLLAALGISHVISGRLSRPVDKLVVDSAENLAQREQAEARLEATSEELQRAARFSADASHQLKTPVTVLRAGLEELLTHEKLSPEECHDISALIHQTYRLSGVIEDLLLLSRMDAGRLKIEFRPINLSHLIEGAIDDLSAQPDALHLSVETDFPSDLYVSGEERYISLILQNLLENARKYNRTGGLIRIRLREEGALVLLAIANSGRPISEEGQAHIFERFHRGAMGENVSGYGLGLNLARELARLHGGDLRLLRSDVELTEFEVRFVSAAARSSGAEVTS